MKRLVTAACVIGISTAAHIGPTAAATKTPKPSACALTLTDPVPKRRPTARSGSDFVNDIHHLRGAERDAAVAEQVLAGNIPKFLRRLIPVKFSWTPNGGKKIDVTICVTPDYLAVGRDSDFVRVPLGLPAAAGIAVQLGFMLPTTKMVDEIYAQAKVRLAPSPMKPTSEMVSTEYFWRHNGTVQDQRKRTGQTAAVLTAGQKKDVVLSNRLRSKPGRVAIYGWHRQNGKPIQPLSTVHGAQYADYSHGIRLVSSIAYVNGAPWSLAELLQDPDLSRMISSEGPISQPNRLMKALR